MGAGYRGVELKEKFEIYGDFPKFLSLTSHFHKTFGEYSEEERAEAVAELKKVLARIPIKKAS